MLLKDENYLGLQTANRTVKGQYPRDRFTFLAAFLTSTRCPEKLLPDIPPQINLLHVAPSLRHDGDLSIRQLAQKMEQILQSVNYSPTLENNVSEKDVDDMSSVQESMNQYGAQIYIGTPHQTPAASPSGFPLFPGNQQLNRFSMTPQFMLTQWPPTYQTATPLNYNLIFAQNETPTTPPQYPITPFSYGGQYGPSFQVNQPSILPNPGFNLSGTWVPQNAPPLMSNLHGGPHQFQRLFPQHWQSNPTGSVHTRSKSASPSSDHSWKVSKSTKKPERPRSLVISETRTSQQLFMSDNT